MKKSKYKLMFRIFISICAAFGWWGILYPELTMLPCTYEIVYEDCAIQKETEVVKWDFNQNIYFDIINTDCSEIHFQSKLLTGIRELQEQGRENHESGE